VQPDRCGNVSELSPQTFCTFPREFSSVGNEVERAATLFPSQVLPIYSCHVRFPVVSENSIVVRQDCGHF
jgi:hypothetical protein